MALWMDILGANAHAVADVLAGLASDLDTVVGALRSLGAQDEAEREAGSLDVEALLRRGNAGHARIPGKHGSPPSRYEAIPVVVGDQPGELARLFADVGRAEVNIEDIRIDHAQGRPAGLVELQVDPVRAETLTVALRECGWTVQR